MRFPRLLAQAGYLLAAMLVVLPFLDLVSAILPLRPGSLTWRFASAGSFSRALMTPLLGLLLASVIGYLLGHGRALRVAAVCSAGLVLMVGFAALRFLIDTGSMWGQAPAEARGLLAFGSVTVLIKLALALVVAVLLTLGARGALGHAVSGAAGDATPPEGRKKPGASVKRETSTGMAAGANPA